MEESVQQKLMKILPKGITLKAFKINGMRILAVSAEEAIKFANLQKQVKRN